MMMDNCKQSKKCINRKFAVGDRVIGNLPWGNISDVDPENPENNLKKVPDFISNQSALSTIGHTGLTAWFGLLKVGRLVEEFKQGSTVVVSGAAGATGNIVGQIAKIKGYRVVGIAGTDDKIAWLKNELKFDEAINYAKVPDLKEALKAACPDGIDLYFDNVGGKTLDIVIQLINRKGVIVNCGAISGYNAVDPPTGPRVEWPVITKSLRMQGFMLFDFASEFDPAIKELSEWLQSGKLIEKVSMFDAQDDVSRIPKAFIDMLGGSNTGKTFVRVSSD